MTRQPSLFGGPDEHSGRQGMLFDASGPRESNDTCGECGEHLVETTSGYWCCPRGHGKLLPQDEPR